MGSAANESSGKALVRVEPHGGIPAVLTIDVQTHLVDSVAVRTPITTDVTTYADYRQAGPFVLPFLISHASTFEPANADRMEVTQYYNIEPRERRRLRKAARGGQRAHARRRHVDDRAHRAGGPSAIGLGIDQRKIADAVHPRHRGPCNPRYGRGADARRACDRFRRERRCRRRNDRAAVCARPQHPYRKCRTARPTHARDSVFLRFLRARPARAARGHLGTRMVRTLRRTHRLHRQAP